MPTWCPSNRQTKKDTRRLFTSINPHNEHITGNKPILWWMEGSTGQTTDKKPTAGQEKSNYRPVSNLSFISEVAEKVTLMQFTTQCDEEQATAWYQSTYRKNHSCETSLVKLVEDLLWAMEEQLVTAVVMLDLSASFNTVDPDLLLEVLEKRFGVTNNAKQWYCKYIKQRKFIVIIGKNKSEPRQLKCSVPQGNMVHFSSFPMPPCYMR